MNEGVVSKETVVLRRWGSSIPKICILLCMLLQIQIKYKYKHFYTNLCILLPHRRSTTVSLETTPSFICYERFSFN